MKKILIGGCSFSQHCGFKNENNNPIFTNWTDFFEREFGNTYKIINRAQSSFGQAKIVESLLEELIKFDFNVDYVIVQWSAVGRSYSINETDFFNKMVNNWEVPFSPHRHEYMLNDDKEGWVTTITNVISESFYRASLNQIFLLKSLLDSKNIPYSMFWGWEQITSDIQLKCNDILELIYDDNFWKWNDHGGISEYIIDNIGTDLGIVKNDFHPSTPGQEFFYNTIIKDIFNTKIRVF